MQQLIKHWLKARTLNQFLFYGWTIFVFAICLMPNSDLPHNAFIQWLDTIHFDKIVHFFLFFISTLFLYLGYKNKHNGWLIIFVPIIIGMIIEFMQGFFPQINRSMDFSDFIADSLGVFVAYFLMKKVSNLNFS